MIKGSKTADIDETMVELAKKDGYTVVTESRVPQADSKVVSADEKSDEKTEVKAPKSKRQ